MSEQVREGNGAAASDYAEVLREAEETFAKIAETLAEMVETFAESAAEAVEAVVETGAALFRALRAVFLREEIRALGREKFREKPRRPRLPFLRRRKAHRIRNDCAKDAGY